MCYDSREMGGEDVFPVEMTTEKEVRFSGLAVSEGVVLARAFVMDSVRKQVVPVYRISAEQVPVELGRLEQAMKTAVEELGELMYTVARRVGPAQAKIFEAQRMMVEDPVLKEQFTGVIRDELLNAEAAVDKTLDRYEALLREVDDEYLMERASDIGEVRRHLLDNLREGEFTAPTRSNRDVFVFSEPRIVIAEELTPGETVRLDPKNTVGFITERGGAASHAAILARALGIPAVSGIKGIHTAVTHGQEVLLDGTSGDVVLWPTKRTLQVYPAAARGGPPQVQVVAPVPGLTVMANISLAEEADRLEAVQAEGIGLYRTEYEFFARGRLLNEDEQYHLYARVVDAMQGRPVYIRLLDMGGDKPAPFLDIPHEENPCLGFRGARLLQGQPELTITQGRALARASRHGEIHVIYPMIVDLMQYLRLRELVVQNTADIAGKNLRHGIMFEVPSACIAARDILEVAEFGSIGTNDLIQYLFAVDRNNSLVAYDYGPDKAPFWILMRQIAEAARETKRPLSVCGEIGGQPAHLPRLLDLGITTLSVSPRMIGLARMCAKKHWNR